MMYDDNSYHDMVRQAVIEVLSVVCAAALIVVVAFFLGYSA